MEILKIKEVLNKFRKIVVSEAKKAVQSNSGSLAASLGSKIYDEEKAIIVEFYGAPYADFVDKGVLGAKDKTVHTGMKRPIPASGRDKPYAYTNKRPPLTSILPWVQQKRFQFQKKKGTSVGGTSTGGQFLSYKQTAYLVAGSIFSRGLPASKFFTKPFNLHYNVLADQLIKEFSVQINKIGKPKDTKK